MPSATQPLVSLGRSPANVVAEVRSAILRGDLLPGEQVRQADWASRLGVSRVPVREALKALDSEGLLIHDPNRGYFVARFGPSEVRQLYLMRRLLEGELLKSLEWPDASVLAALEQLAVQAEEAFVAIDFERWNDLEHRFHQVLYGLSPFALVRSEVDRLWLLSNLYRALSFRMGSPSQGSPGHVYYRRMVDALVAHDRDTMLQLMTTLRENAEHMYTRLLERRPLGGD